MIRFELQSLSLRVIIGTLKGSIKQLITTRPDILQLHLKIILSQAKRAEARSTHDADASCSRKYSAAKKQATNCWKTREVLAALENFTNDL